MARLSLLVGAAALTVAQPAPAPIDYNKAPPNLSTLANFSIYETWRPRAHILPPYGQIGDPCMHYTDPETGLFHVGWLHQGAAGATTDDLVTYKDLNKDGLPFIRAGGVNDPIAVFDGSVIPSGIDGKPTLFYTSVSFLPIQWTIPYTRGSETQSLAVTSDGGRNFTKLEQGPVIADHPFGLNVTGFRDPFVFQSPQLDALLNSTADTWYTVISGGVQQQGPSEFLYRQTDPDYQYWEYLGEWWREAANTTWGSGNWAGRWGFNFEVANVFHLDDQGYNTAGEFFTTLGAEWSLEPIVPQVSDFREMLWAAGNVSLNDDGAVEFTPTMAGKLDWGDSAYAAAGKLLPASSEASQKSGAPDRFISYLWLTGDFFGTLTEFPTRQQNWTGSLLLPRELSVGYIDDVVDNGLVGEIGSWRVEKNESGVVQLATLKQEIARETLAGLTSGEACTEAATTLTETGTQALQCSPESKFYTLTTTLTFPQSARGSDLQAGFQILAGPYESTTIYYQFSNESVIIDRSNTSAAAFTTSDIDVRPEAGRLRLFDLVRSNQTQIETLNLTLVVDNSVVEVHANGRFALSTWVRSWYATSTEIRYFKNGTGEVEVGEIKVYEGLFDAWPDREGLAANSTYRH